MNGNIIQGKNFILLHAIYSINIDTDQIQIIIRLNNNLHQTGLVLSIRRQKLSFDIK